MSIRLERRGPIGLLLIDRPGKRNALTYEMWQEVGRLATDAERDDDVGVLVITGADSSAFSAGADITEFETHRNDARMAAAYNAAVREAEAAVDAMRKPTIAFVRGVCVGGGCGLALACDLRLCDTTARFGITASKLGIVYSLTATKRLVDVVGPARAKYILYSSQMIGASEALTFGLVDQVFEESTAFEDAMTFADVIASRAPHSVRASKEMVTRILRGQVEDDDETTAIRDAGFDSVDYQARVRAFTSRERLNGD